MGIRSAVAQKERVAKKEKVGGGVGVKRRDGRVDTHVHASYTCCAAHKDSIRYMEPTWAQ